MASLSLREAAEQTGKSKVDIWRAIQDGTLPAQRTNDGGFAIDPAELFRVFEPERHERPTGQDATASLSLREAAEQTGKSKVDIWRAIQDGTLPAQRTDEGGFAIDPAELFRVFEPERHERPTGQDAMASLSLREAAEQTGKSKVDIWRAIQDGTLPAQRTDEGGFAIDPAELFRVFEPERHDERPTGQDAMASPEASEQPETSAPETAATDDMAVAFAALGAELKGLLELPAEAGKAGPVRRKKRPRHRSVT